MLLQIFAFSAIWYVAFDGPATNTITGEQAREALIEMIMTRNQNMRDSLDSLKKASIRKIDKDLIEIDGWSIDLKKRTFGTYFNGSAYYVTFVGGAFERTSAGEWYAHVTSVTKFRLPKKRSTK